MSDDPDPGHMVRFCREVLPGMLVDACGIAPPDAGRVAKDVLSRAEAAARLDRDSCEILAAPFFVFVVPVRHGSHGLGERPVVVVGFDEIGL
jgi:hypothetical protein